MKGEPRTLVQAIVEAISVQIHHGALAAGNKLPSLRQYAKMHGCSINTVVSAFEALVSKNLIESRRGSGFYVVATVKQDIADDDASSLARAIDIVWLMREQVRPINGHIPAGDGFPPAEWLADSRLSKHLQQPKRIDAKSMFRYGTRHGYLPLRQQLVQRLAHATIEAAANQIVLTHGGNAALNVIVSYFVKPGDVVLVDDPGYYPLFGKLKLHGAEIIGIPRQKDGPDVAAFEAQLAKHRPKLFFTQSIGHNPTGSDISPAKAHRLLQLAEKHNVYIVDSDPFADLYGRHATRLGALDQLSRTIYVGTFSKTISPALRVGFLACRADLASDLADVKMLMDVSTSEYNERIVSQIIEESHFQRYLSRLTDRVTHANSEAVAFLRSIDATVFFHSPHSLFLWVSFPGIDDTTELVRRLLVHDVAVAPGGIFQVNPQPKNPWCRLNVAYVTDPRFKSALMEECRRSTTAP
jgi:DNA-binding transcriptional MocR family regulator